MNKENRVHDDSTDDEIFDTLSDSSLDDIENQHIDMKMDNESEEFRYCLNVSYDS